MKNDNLEDKSKNRINFLKLLRAGHNDFVINEDALEYMQKHRLPEFQFKKLRSSKEKIPPFWKILALKMNEAIT